MNNVQPSALRPPTAPLSTKAAAKPVAVLPVSTVNPTSPLEAGRVSISEETKRLLTTKALQEFLKLFPDMALDGLLDVPFDKLPDLFILELASRHLPAIQDKRGFISAFKKQKQLDQLFKNPSEKVNRGIQIVRLLILNGGYYPLRDVLGSIKTSVPIKTVCYLLSLQERLLSTIAPLYAEMKQGLMEYKPAEEREKTKLTNDFVGESLAFHAKVASKMRSFFRYNRMQLSQVKNECSALVLCERAPQFLYMVREFAKNTERQLGMMRVSTQDCLQFQAQVDECYDCTSLPPKRSPHATQRILTFSRNNAQNYVIYFEKLRDFFAALPPFPLKPANGACFQAVLFFLAGYHKINEKERENYLFQDLERFKILMDPSEIAVIQKLVEFLPRLSQETLKGRAENYNAYQKSLLIPSVNSLGEEYYRQEMNEALCLICGQFAAKTFMRMAPTHHFFKLIGDALTLQVNEMILMFDSERFKTKALTDYNNAYSVRYVINPALKKFHHEASKDIKDVLRFLGEYLPLVELSGAVFPFFKEPLVELTKELELVSHRSCLELLAEANKKVARLKKERKAQAALPPAKRVPVPKVPETPRPTPKTKTPPPVFSADLFLIRDVWCAVPAPHLVKGNLDRATLMRYDEAYHVSHLKWRFELIEKSIQRGLGCHLPLLLSHFINHLYLAEEQMSSVHYLTQFPDSPLEHGLENKQPALTLPYAEELDFTSYWSRNPHKCSTYYQTPPAGLQVLLDLHNEKMESTAKFVEILKGSFKTLFEETEKRLSGPVCSHIQQEKGRFISRLDILTNASFTPPPSTPPQKLLDLRATLLKLIGTDVLLAKDLDVHLKRLIQSLQLLHDFPEPCYLAVHTSHILTSGQYLLEFVGAMLSIQKEEETHTHDLRYYAERYDFQSLLGKRLESYIQFNLRKGGDYPYWTATKKREKHAKAFGWLSDAYHISSVPSGFTPAALNSNDLVSQPAQFLERKVDELADILGSLLAAIK